MSNYEKELEEMKHMTRQEFVASLRRLDFLAMLYLTCIFPLSFVGVLRYLQFFAISLSLFPNILFSLYFMVLQEK